MRTYAPRASSAAISSLVRASKDLDPALVAEDARDLLRVVRGEPDEAHVGGKENQLLDLSGLASLVSGDGIDRFPCELGSLRIEEGEGRRGLWNLGEQVLDDGVRVARMNGGAGSVRVAAVDQSLSGPVVLLA
ncbi:MAG TPA: hypothetical protein VI039_06170 [Solirubrobacterales bacterium]